MLHVNTSVDTDSDIEGALWTQHKLVDAMFLKKLLCYDLPNISNAFSYLIQHLQNFFFLWMFGNWKLFSSYLFIFSPLSCIVEVYVVHYHPSLSISSNAPKKVRNVGRYQQSWDFIIKTLLNSTSRGQKLHRVPLMMMLLAFCVAYAAVNYSGRV